MKTLFGTDGVRGVANEYPMTSEMVVKIGRAVAYFFQKKNTRSKIIVGKDTRISGDMIEQGQTHIYPEFYPHPALLS